MNVEPYPDDFTLRMAQTLGKQGFRVVRVYEGDKRPVGLDWPKLATADVEVLTSQFEPGGVGIGVACGPQPNGRDLVVVDVDVKHDGMANWERIVAEHGPFPVTATHTTPSGGMHLFWDSPETFSNGKLAPGVDIRGQGGQVVVPPSWRLINDERVFYRPRWKGAGIHQHHTSALPIAIWEMLQRPSAIEIEASITRHPSQEPLSNADWLRDHWDWVAVLEAQGHTMVRQLGRDIYLRHPTATAEHSAVVHLDPNMMNAWSTNMPEPLREAQVNRDGSIAWSPFDWFTATQHDGNYTAAMTEIYRRRGIVGAAPPQRAGSREPPSIEATSTLVVPEEFWTSSPIYEHIRTEAWSALMPPSLALGAVLTRYAATIPCCYRIPPIVGRVGSLNLAVCIVSSSGGGKTSMMDAAVALVPSSLDEPDGLGRPGKTMFNQGMGSGEGMIEAFYEELSTQDAKGKTISERVRWYDAVNFMIDEGGTVLAQLERSGSTEIDYFNSMWASATVSTRTASKDRRRHLPAHSYRWTAALNIQAARGHKFLVPELVVTGFPQRLLFVWGDDPTLPDEDLDPLGALDLPLWPVVPEMHISFDDDIWAQVRSYRRQRARGTITEHALDRHRWLTREKTAAILAFMHGEKHVSATYWHQSCLLHDASDAIRDHLISLDRQTSSDRRHSAAEVAGEMDAVRVDATKRKQVATYAQRLLRHIRAAGKDGMALNDWRKKLTRDERWAFEACRDRLVDDALVRIDGDRAFSV